MDATTPVIKPRLVNLVVPMLTVIVLSIFFFWFLGSQPPRARSGEAPR